MLGMHLATNLKGRAWLTCYNSKDHFVILIVSKTKLIQSYNPGTKLDNYLDETQYTVQIKKFSKDKMKYVKIFMSACLDVRNGISHA